MKVKSVVKVMNFHALLRADKSKKQAEKFLAMEKQLMDMISLITNNRNFLLDKKIVKPDNSKPALEIHIGSDLGFCGSINSNVGSVLKKSDAVKVVIGKKLKNKTNENVAMKFNRNDFNDNLEQIHQLMVDAIINRKYRSVTVVYNHYHNISNIEFTKKTIYPLENEIKQGTGQLNDYVIESDKDNLLELIIIQYLEYEIRIAWANAFASENISRQKTTNESLKKIGEIEEEQAKLLRKERKMRSFRKVLSESINKKGIGTQL